MPLKVIKPSELPPSWRLARHTLTSTRVLVLMLKSQVGSGANRILLPPGSSDQAAASPLGVVVAVGPAVTPDIEPGAYVLATNVRGSELYSEPSTDSSWRLFDHTDIQAVVYLEETN